MYDRNAPATREDDRAHSSAFLQRGPRSTRVIPMLHSAPTSTPEYARQLTAAQEAFRLAQESQFEQPSQ